MGSIPNKSWRGDVQHYLYRAIFLSCSSSPPPPATAVTLRPPAPEKQTNKRFSPSPWRRSTRRKCVTSPHEPAAIPPQQTQFRPRHPQRPHTRALGACAFAAVGAPSACLPRRRTTPPTYGCLDPGVLRLPTLLGGTVSPRRV